MSKQESKRKPKGRRRVRKKQKGDALYNRIIVVLLIALAVLVAVVGVYYVSTLFVTKVPTASINSSPNLSTKQLPAAMKRDVPSAGEPSQMKETVSLLEGILSGVKSDKEEKALRTINAWRRGFKLNKKREPFFVSARLAKVPDELSLGMFGHCAIHGDYHGVVLTRKNGMIQEGWVCIKNKYMVSKHSFD